MRNEKMVRELRGFWFIFESIEMRDRFLQLYGDLIINWHEGGKPTTIKIQIKNGTIHEIKKGLGDLVTHQWRSHIYVGNVA